MRWNRVVVPVDFSEEAFAALSAARELVERPSQLYVVYVVADPHDHEPPELREAGDDARRHRVALKLLEQRVMGTPLDGARCHVATGEPGPQIVELAERMGADLIVIPSRNRKGIKRLFLGSVAETVVRQASCAVLVLRR